MVKLSRRIAVSEKVYNYMKNEVEVQFLENNPAYDGKKVSMDQKMRSLIKTYCKLIQL